MAERPSIAFYHLQKSTLEQVLPVLLQKTLDAGQRALVRTVTPARAEALDHALWTFSDDSFLPHGCNRTAGPDDHGPAQRVWLTAGEDNPAMAPWLFLTDGVDIADAGTPEGFERVFVMIADNDEQAKNTARAQWKRWVAGGLGLTYWQQSATGRWEKARESMPGADPA